MSIHGEASSFVSEGDHRSGATAGAHPFANGGDEHHVSVSQTRQVMAEAQELAQAGVWYWQIDSGELWWSDGVYGIYGLASNAIPATYQAFIDHVHPDDRLALWHNVEAALAGTDVHDFRYRILREGGEVRHVHERGRVVRDEQGRPITMVGAVVDVTDDTQLRMQLEDAVTALADSEARYRMLAENSSDVIFLSDAETDLNWVSPSAAQTLGWTPASLIGHRATEFIHPDDLPRLLAEIERSTATGEEIRPRYRWRRPDGTYRWMEAAGRPVDDDGHGQPGRVVELRDVDAEMIAIAALEQSEVQYRLLAENAYDVVWTMSLEGTITYISPAVLRTRGLTPEEAMRQSLEEIHPAGSLALVQQYFSDLGVALAAGSALPDFHAEIEYYRKDGSCMWGELQVTVQVDKNGKPVQIMGVTRDISARKHYEAELNRLAITDPLTGVWNRRHAEDLLVSDMAEARRYGPALSLLVIDIDHFKRVNDTYGHQTGDRVLVELTNRLSANLRASDVLARWGGEEFVVMMRQCSITDAIPLAEKLRLLIADTPFDGVGYMSVSIGAAQLHESDDVRSWIDRADRAMYQAKAAGRNALRVIA